jgi:hypothetical protein
MYGGPFHSAGFVRIVNGVKYNCQHVSYAHWVTLMNGGHSLDTVLVKVNRRKVWQGPDSALDAFLDAHSATVTGPV